MKFFTLYNVTVYLYYVHVTVIEWEMHALCNASTLVIYKYSHQITIKIFTTFYTYRYATNMTIISMIEIPIRNGLSKINFFFSLKANPLRFIPNAFTQYILMFYLSVMWTVVFTLWTGYSIYFGIGSVGGHLLVISAFFLDLETKFPSSS